MHHSFNLSVNLKLHQKVKKKKERDDSEYLTALSAAGGHLSNQKRGRQFCVLEETQVINNDVTLPQLVLFYVVSLKKEPWLHTKVR